MAKKRQDISVERTRAIRRILRSILLVIAIMIALAAGCTVAAGNCAEPTSLHFSDEFLRIMKDNRDRPGTVAWLLFDEVSRQLSWHGKSSLYMLQFSESCFVSRCSTDTLDMIVEFEHHPICSWSSSRFNHSLASVKIADITNPEPIFFLSVIREGYGAHQPSPIFFSTEMDWIRNSAMQDIQNADWGRYPEIEISYYSPHEKWHNKHWDVSIRADQTRLYSAKVPHPDPLQVLRFQFR